MRPIVVLLLLLASSVAHAGVYSDDMAKCLVSATSPQDKTALVRWIFANAALHPDVSSISRVTPESRDSMNRAAAELVERLLTVACRQQTMDAMRYEGPAAFQASFQVLGQVAMQELMSDKAVSAGFEQFSRYINKEKMEALGRR